MNFKKDVPDFPKVVPFNLTIQGSLYANSQQENQIFMRVNGGMVDMLHGILITDSRLLDATFHEIKVGVISWEYVL